MLNCLYSSESENCSGGKFEVIQAHREADFVQELKDAVTIAYFCKNSVLRIDCYRSQPNFHNVTVKVPTLIMVINSHFSNKL